MHLKYRNAERKLSTLRQKINDHQRLTMLLATHDVKRLRDLLAVALRRGASPRALISQIERSLAGLYHPRSQLDQRELDVALLAKALGGPRLLHALVHSHGFPSASTLSRHVHIPQLFPCTGRPTTKDVNTNITAMFDPELKAAMLVHSPDPLSREVAGCIMMIDGVALEERCRYCTRDNCVTGLCREHSQGIRTKINVLGDVQELEAALHPQNKDGVTPPATVHYGKDGTVVAVAPYAQTNHYSPVPLLVSSSCKSETGEELAAWLNVVLDAWKSHPHGEQTHGPIWALASDGESSFRRARFLLCMTEQINATSALGQRLAGLVGLNMYTGSGGLCGTCDPKHVIKRE